MGFARTRNIRQQALQKYEQQLSGFDSRQQQVAYVKSVVEGQFYWGNPSKGELAALLTVCFDSKYLDMNRKWMQNDIGLPVHHLNSIERGEEDMPPRFMPLLKEQLGKLLKQEWDLQQYQKAPALKYETGGKPADINGNSMEM